jgi:hypothetical protein
VPERLHFVNYFGKTGTPFFAITPGSDSFGVKPVVFRVGPSIEDGRYPPSGRSDRLIPPRSIAAGIDRFRGAWWVSVNSFDGNRWSGSPGGWVSIGLFEDVEVGELVEKSKNPGGWSRKT